MTTPMIITLLIVVGVIAMILTDKFAFGAPALIGCVLLVLTGVADIPTAFSGFIDKNLILIAAFMVVMAAFQRTTLIESVKKGLHSMVRKGGLRNYALMLLFIMLVSNFIAGTGFYVLVISIVATIPYDKKLPVSKILAPLAFATGFGGFLPVQSGMFIGIVNGQLQNGGAVNAAGASVLTLCLISLFKAIMFFAFAMVAWRWLPDRPIDSSSAELENAEAKVAEKLPKTQEIVTYIATLISVVGMMFMTQLGDIAYILPAVSVSLLFLSKAMSFKEIRINLASPLVLMIAGMFGLANAMASTGLTAWLGSAVVGLLGASVSPWVLMFVFVTLEVIMVNLTGANFGSLFICCPIAVATSVQMGYDPTAIAMALTIAAWGAFVLPVDGLTAMTLSVGKYKLKEQLRFTGPLQILYIIVLCVSSMLLIPMA